MSKIKIRRGVAGRQLVARLYRILEEVFNARLERYISGRLEYTCINNTCIVYEASTGFTERNLVVLYMSSWIAIVVRGEVVPSITLADRIFREKGYRATIIVGDKGVKAFLYGNDILPESIVEKHEPVDSIVAVVDSSDYEILGFAKYNPRRRIYENIYDLGVYLRILG
ncbi:MAG: hypothetical protein OWQ48_03335 [Desulfurococcus sp.]|nr:hypothetical protein [Desulfurococcus sp.]